MGLIAFSERLALVQGQNTCFSRVDEHVNCADGYSRMNSIERVKLDAKREPIKGVDLPLWMTFDIELCVYLEWALRQHNISGLVLCYHPCEPSMQKTELSSSSCHVEGWVVRA